MKFKERLEEWRWMLNMRRIRRYHMSLSLDQREIFYSYLRPKVSGYPYSVMSFPDAFMYVKIDDVIMAITAVNLNLKSK